MLAKYISLHLLKPNSLSSSLKKMPQRSAESFFPAVKDQNDRADIMALDPMGNQYQLTLRFWHNQAS